MVRMCASIGPHRWPMRVLFGGVKVWRRIKSAVLGVGLVEK
jgi:hypothetical protein